jgi:YVTN family beta-propeller protein/YD repeat-containing protein
MVVLLVVVLVALVAPVVARADIVYLYDDLGRLARVIRPDGTAATYHYDAVGNILRITRETGVAQSTTITPPAVDSGAQGSRVTVTILGTNLFGATLCSPNPGISFENIRSDGDSITFDVVIAPGAPTGLTSLCVEGATIVSTPFTVDQSSTPAPPTITAFAATSGGIGDLVTIDGTGFDETTPANNVVRFNGVTATLVSAISTRLTARVPAGATTGLISVTTPNGTAASADVFTVLAVHVVATIRPPFLAPRDLVLRPDGSRAYVANGGRNTISVIDTATHGIVADIPASIGELAVSPDGTRLYSLGTDVNTGNSVVSVVDLTINAALTDVTLTTFAGAHLAVTPDGAAVFVLAGDGTLTVVDTATSTEATIIAIPAAFGGFLAIAPDGAQAYVTLPSESSITVVDVASRAVTATIPIGASAAEGVFNPTAARFYLPADSDITVIDTSTNTVAATVPGVRGALAVNPAGTRLYVTGVTFDASSVPTGTLTVIDTAGNSVSTTVPLPEIAPRGLAVTPDGETVVVFSDTEASRRDALAVIDAATNTLDHVVNLNGEDAFKAAVLPDGQTVYLAMAGSNSVSVVDVTASLPLDAPISRTGAGMGFWLFTPPIITSDGGTVYGSSGDSPFGAPGFVASFDVATLAPRPNVTVAHKIEGSGQRPGISAFAVDPVTGGTLYVATRTFLHFVDPATAVTRATVPVALPERMWPSADGAELLVVDGFGFVRRIDTTTATEIASISVSRADGVAITPDRSRLYVSNIVTNSVAVFDPAGPTHVGTISVGGLPTQIGISADGTRLLSRNQGSGTVTLVDTATGATVASFPFPSGTVTTPIETSLTAPRAFFGTSSPNITVVDTSTDSILTTVPLPARPTHLTLSPDGTRLYVVHSLNALMTVVDVQANAVIGTVTLTGQLRRAAVLPNNRAFVPSLGSPIGPPTAVFVVE